MITVTHPHKDDWKSHIAALEMTSQIMQASLIDPINTEIQQERRNIIDAAVKRVNDARLAVLRMLASLPTGKVNESSQSYGKLTQVVGALRRQIEYADNKYCAKGIHPIIQAALEKNNQLLKDLSDRRGKMSPKTQEHLEAAQSAENQ
jgi:hypothetical protein